MQKYIYIKLLFTTIINTICLCFIIPIHLVLLILIVLINFIYKRKIINKTILEKKLDSYIESVEFGYHLLYFKLKITLINLFGKTK